MKPQRIVNVHQAKTHLSRLIDDAHALLEPISPAELAEGESGGLVPEAPQR